MTISKTFDSRDLAMDGLLDNILVGKVQLPDFQREWVWDDEHVKSLLASVSLSYPIGAIMMLEADTSNMTFKPLPLKGVALNDGQLPEHLVLDGQQRLTSLFLALRSGIAVPTKDARKSPIKRWYYIDIKKALNPYEDREEAIFSVPEDKILRDFRSQPIADFSTPENEFEAEVFPLAEILDSSDWQLAYYKLWKYDPEHMERYTEFHENVVKRFQAYQVPAIVLAKETPKEAVCQVFEKVNTGGVSLTVFELLTATYAIDGFELRKNWKAREQKLREDKAPRSLRALVETDFIQAITLLATRARRAVAKAAGDDPERLPAISARRKDMLRLKLADYLEYADRVQEALLAAGRLLSSQKVFTARDLPYKTQLVPLAAILVALGQKAENEGVRQKLIRWYWCGVLGELYGATTETRFARDLAEVVAWVSGGPEPATVAEALFNRDRLFTMRTRNSAAYKGLYALLMRDGGRDLRTGETIEIASYFDEAIDIHHLFPQRWCLDHGIDMGRCNSIVNKTPISGKTNRMIGGNAPSDYLARMQKSAEIAPGAMDEILGSHLADPVAMRADDFGVFYAAREAAILQRIEAAMGKPVVGGSGVELEESEDADEEEMDE
jgi:hypothetical protein